MPAPDFLLLILFFTSRLNLPRMPSIFFRSNSSVRLRINTDNTDLIWRNACNRRFLFFVVFVFDLPQTGGELENFQLIGDRVSVPLCIDYDAIWKRRKGPCQTSGLAAAVAKRPGRCGTTFERGYIDSYVKR